MHLIVLPKTAWPPTLLQERIAAAEAQLLASTKSTNQRLVPLLTTAAAAQAHFADGLAFDSAARDADPRFAFGFIDDDYVSDLRRVASGAAGTEEILGTVGRILQISEQRGSPTHSAGTSEWRSLARRLPAISSRCLRVSFIGAVVGWYLYINRSSPSAGELGSSNHNRAV